MFKPFRELLILESPQPTVFPERAGIGDGGLLSGLPCAIPCVYGIQIGETLLDQVIPVLEQNGLAECQTVRASGGGTTIPPEDYDGVKVKWIVFDASDQHRQDHFFQIDNNYGPDARCK